MNLRRFLPAYYLSLGIGICTIEFYANICLAGQEPYIQPEHRAEKIAQIQANAQQEYAIQANGNHFMAQRLPNLPKIAFTDQGVTMQLASPQPAEWSMQTVAFGCETDLQLVPATKPQQPTFNRIEYDYPQIHGTSFTEWYVHGPLGLEQRFTIASAPTCGHREQNSNVVVRLNLSGDLQPQQQANAIAWYDATGHLALQYDELFAFDATGKTLPVTLNYHDHRRSIGMI